MSALKYLLISFIAILAFVDPAFAADNAGHILSTKGTIALAVGLAAIGGATAQSKAITSALESIARNPGAAGSMFLPWLLALVFIETLVLFTFALAFVL